MAAAMVTVAQAASLSDPSQVPRGCSNSEKGWEARGRRGGPAQVAGRVGVAGQILAVRLTQCGGLGLRFGQLTGHLPVVIPGYHRPRHRDWRA
jgi:hypothetical protein